MVVEFGDVIDRALSAQVLQFSDRIRAANIAGLIETVPTIRSVLVHYDPLVTSGTVVTEKLGALIGTSDVRSIRQHAERCTRAELLCAPVKQSFAETGKDTNP